MFPALKSYFLSQEKCLMILKKMFNDPVSLVWIYFLESQMKVHSISMRKIQSDSISGSEVAVELSIFVKQSEKQEG
jgi:DNA polymerase III delta subunit